VEVVYEKSRDNILDYFLWGLLQIIIILAGQCDHGKMRQMRQLKKGGDIALFRLNIRFYICAYRQINSMFLRHYKKSVLFLIPRFHLYNY